MKIIKYSKKRDNIYEITLENGEKIKLYQDVILKYNLLIKKEITEKIKKDIEEENSYYLGYYLAIKYIAKKIRCKKEIIDYLNKKDISKKYIDKILISLEKEKLIDEELYVKLYTKDRFNLNNYGPMKIRRELLDLKIDDNVVDKNLYIDEEELKEKLSKLMDKRYKQLNKYNGNILKNKMIEYFYNKGYSKEIIIDVFESKKFDNSDNYEREYNKLYNKYKNKYNGKELDLFIKNKLYLKGFIK